MLKQKIMKRQFGYWIVTEKGIEWNREKPGDYFIERSRLLELGPAEEQLYEWLIHIPQKTWLNKQDVLDLNEAFCFAAEEFGYEIDETIYRNTINEQKWIIEDK
jgi:hypothetical protein